MAGLVGAVTGFGVAAFERIVVNGLLLHLEELPLWMVALAPMVGLLLALAALEVHRSAACRPRRRTSTCARSTIRPSPSRSAGWRRA